MVAEANNLEFILKLFGSAEVAAGLDRVIKGIDGTSVSADRAAVATDRFDQTLRVLAGALDRDIVASDRAAKANAGLGDSYKFVAVSADQSVASINASTAAYERNAAASASAATGMRNIVGGPAATGLIKASKWIAGGAAITAYESIKKYMSFQQSVTESITQAGVPISEQKAIMSGLLDISTKVGVKANDMAAIFFRVASSVSGTHTPLKKMLEISSAIAKLNVLGNVAPGQASEQTARVVMALYNLNLKGTGHNLDKIIGTVSGISGSSDARSRDVIAGFSSGLGLAAQQYGLSAAEAGAVFSVYTKLGMKPASAGVYAGRSIQQIFSPTVQGSKGLGILGIDPFQLKHIEDTKGFGAAMAFLNDKLSGDIKPLGSYAKYKGKTGVAAAQTQLQTWFNGSLTQTMINDLGKKVTGADFKNELSNQLKKGTGLTPEQWSVIKNMIITRAFGGQRGALQVGGLLGNLDLYFSALGNIQNNSNPKKVNNLTSIALKTPGQQFKMIEARISADFIKIGQIITPTFIKIAKAIVEFFDVFSKFKYAVKDVVDVLGLVLVIGIGLKSLRTAFKVFDFFKTLRTTKIKDLITGSKATEPIVAAGAEMQGAAKIQADAAAVQLRAAEMFSMGGVAGAERSAFRAVEGGATTGKGLFLRESFGTGRKPIGIAYAEQQSRVHAGAMMPPYMGQAGVGVAKVAEGEAIKTTEKVGLGAMAKGAMGAVGGALMSPFGMIGLMMAMPLIFSVVGKLPGLLSGLFKTPATYNAPTQTEAQKQAAAAAKLAAKQKAAAAAGGLGDVTAYLNSIDKYNVQSGHGKGKWAANNFAYLWQKNFGFMMSNGQYYGQNTKEIDRLSAQIKKDPVFAAYIKKNRADIYGAVMGYSTQQQLSKNKVMQRLAADQLTGKAITGSDAAFKAANDSKNSPLARAGAAMQGIVDMTTARNQELALMNKKDAKGKYVLDASVRAEYQSATVELNKRIKALGENLKNNEKQNIPSGRLQQADLKAWLTEASSKQSQAFKDAGLTPEKFGAAVAAALAGSGHWKHN
jgi:hypothetical protein